MSEQTSPRRAFLQTAGAALTTSLFTGNVRGANDKVSLAVIGVGRMGSDNLRISMKQENVAISAVCDVYQPNLDRAVEISNKQAKPVKDFREILADKSIDAVCIATPDHWHPYMTIEACKAGKDVYCEKPVCVTIEEGRKMVQAARKYNRVVQAGTMQRSGKWFQMATDLVKQGKIGEVKFCRTFNYANMKPEGIGKPADSAPPADLNWDMWLGPAPKRPYNASRFGYDIEQGDHPRWYSNFRYFWDYAGGMMTDWGVHLLDIVHMAMGEKMPKSINGFGEKLWLDDNRETPDTLAVSYDYPGFLATYENRNSNANSLVDNYGYGTFFHGTDATLLVNRAGFKVIPEAGRKGVEALEVSSKEYPSMNAMHWANFLECIKTRQRPVSDIEVCAKVSAACILGNVAIRSRMRLDWDDQNWTVTQKEAKKYLSREERGPWKLVV